MANFARIEILNFSYPLQTQKCSSTDYHMSGNDIGISVWYRIKTCLISICQLMICYHRYCFLFVFKSITSQEVLMFIYSSWLTLLFEIFTVRVTAAVVYIKINKRHYLIHTDILKGAYKPLVCMNIYIYIYIYIYISIYLWIEQYIYIYIYIYICVCVCVRVCVSK